MQMRQDVRQKVPSFGFDSMSTMSAEELEQLAMEMVEAAEQGGMSRVPNSTSGGNLVDTRFFLHHAESIANAHDRRRDAEYAISSKLEIQSTTAQIRSKIEEMFKRLKRVGQGKEANNFSMRFLHGFDWITQSREKAVSYAIEHQKEFVIEPYDPLLLHPLNQDDLAAEIGCHAATVSRLVKDLLIEFPDTITREFAILVPGTSLSTIKGRYVVGILASNPEYFDGLEWKISDEIMADILRREYGLSVQRRAVTNYKQWVNDHLLTKRRDSNKRCENVQNSTEDDEEGR